MRHWFFAGFICALATVAIGNAAGLHPGATDYPERTALVMVVVAILAVFLAARSLR
jgi:hypothetical protein